MLAVPGLARAAACGLPDAAPVWIDYGDRFVPFRNALFARPGLVVAAGDPLAAQQLRAGGARTVFWDMYLNKRVGTPSAPADPTTIAGRASRLVDFAAKTSGCSTPLIALNELFGSQLPAPWSASNRVYRANVLALVRAIAARGGRPSLLISHPPATGGEAGVWWRALARVSDIVREVYVPAPQTAALGVARGSFVLRQTLRRAVRDLTQLGIEPLRVGLVLGFHSHPGGRDGLQPASAWFEVVKLEALAARRVALQLGVGTIWSWGWGVWPGEPEADKRAAACVYLWAREPGLCDGPAAAGAGFDASLEEERGGVTVPRARREQVGFAVVRRGDAVWMRVRVAPSVRGRTVEFQRRSNSSTWVSFERATLVRPTVWVRARLPHGLTALRARLTQSSLVSRIRFVRAG